MEPGKRFSKVKRSFHKYITNAYHNKRCTGRHQDIGKGQVGHERTGGAQWINIYKIWGSTGRKQMW